MDLSEFSGLAKRLEMGRRVDVLHPVTGKKTGLWVEVVSYESERCKRVQRELADAALKEARRNPKKVATSTEIEEKSLMIAAAAVTNWNFTLDGEPLECTPENVLDTLKNPDHFFLVRLVDREAGEEHDFLSRSSTTSGKRSRSQSDTISSVKVDEASESA